MSKKIRLDYWPVFLEPIIDSGERLCVGICYRSDSGDVFYNFVLRSNVSDALLLNKKSAIGNLSRYACEYARSVIKKEVERLDLEASGISVGKKRVVEGYDLQEMHERAVRKVSFFSYLEFTSKKKSEKEQSYGLVDMVYDDMKKMKSPLLKSFYKQLKIPGGIKEFHFADERGGLAANFYQFQKGARIFKAELYCLDLSMVSHAYRRSSLIALMDGAYLSKSKRKRDYQEVEGAAKHLNVELKVITRRDEAVKFINDNAA